MTTPEWKSDQEKEPMRPSQLQESDYFKKIQDVEVRKGLKIGVYGDPEVGKSFFGDTCPPPVFVIDTDLAAVKLAKQHFPQKDIRVCEVKVVSEVTMQPDPIKSMYELENAIIALKSVQQGTIVVDNVTDYWQFVCAWMETQATRRTKSGQPMRFEYAMANERYKYFIMRLLVMPITVVLIAQSQQAYTEDGRETNIAKPRWQKQSPFWTDIVLHFEKRNITNQWVYQATIEKCRFQRAFSATITDCTYEKLVEVLREKLKVSINVM
jgi:hypothetical protein